MDQVENASELKILLSNKVLLLITLFSKERAIRQDIVACKNEYGIITRFPYFLHIKVIIEVHTTKGIAYNF